ncbi:hypothetical protein Y032_0479g2212 [Ancylostoma ceylanicum]|uniref:G-protein coupled receptors family 1 profile domain-containing protein n=1 Tax=Ancylostoma ceylanicum TaxID=53326 RepID=A0A016WVI8_9BILA|nr:hypothetical protein Y032_0479g2212 [Ancylostoma ceylanicum]
MSTDKELRYSPQYKLMNQYNFVDCGQAFFHLSLGALIVFPVTQQRFQPVARVITVTGNSLWIAMFPIMSVLSISRILVIIDKASPNRLPTTLKVLNAIGMVFSASLWLWGCFTQNLTIVGLGIEYDFSKFGASVVALAEWYLCFPCLVVTYITYLAIVLHMELRKHMEKQGGISSPEIKLFLQSTFLFLYISSIIIIWHNAESWGLWSSLTNTALSFAWVFLPYWNVLLLLTLNRTFRLKMVQFIYRRDKVINFAKTGTPKKLPSHSPLFTSIQE